ncbi:MAG: glycosyltransferase family 9 protein [Gemmatimonadota bacterium]
MADLQDRFGSICIVMLSAIGDAVHVLPVANALKRIAPAVPLTWVIQPVPYMLVRDHPAIDNFIIFRRSRGTRVLRDYRETLGHLRRQRFDLVINLQVYLKAGLLTAGARADMKLGFDRARARDLNWLFTTHRIPAHEPQHVQDQYFEFLDYLGITPEPVEWRIALSEEEKDAQRRFFEKFDRPVCAVVTGTSKAQKNWAPDRYAKLLEIIENDFGYRTIVVGGPSAVEKSRASEIIRLTSARPANELGDDLRRLVYLLGGADIVVSPDTGPLHIARALDVPVIGLYGYTNPKRTGPYRKYTDLVADGYSRYPGEAYPVSMQYRDGMKRLTVQMAAEKVELAIKKYVS